MVVHILSFTTGWLLYTLHLVICAVPPDGCGVEVFFLLSVSSQLATSTLVPLVSTNHWDMFSTLFCVCVCVLPVLVCCSLTLYHAGHVVDDW